LEEEIIVTIHKKQHLSRQVAIKINYLCATFFFLCQSYFRNKTKQSTCAAWLQAEKQKDQLVCNILLSVSPTAKTKQNNQPVQHGHMCKSQEVQTKNNT